MAGASEKIKILHGFVTCHLDNKLLPNTVDIDTIAYSDIS
jgi:hypothetical protein